MPYVSDRQRRFFHSSGARKAGITPIQVHEFDEASKGMNLPDRIDHKARGGVVRCPGCGMHHYADGGDVESLQQKQDRHEAERQQRNNEYTENAMASLHQGRDRVAVSEDEKKPRPHPLDSAQASNYAHGGLVDDDLPVHNIEREYVDADDIPEFEEERRYANDGMRRLDRMVHRGWQSEAPAGRSIYAGEGDNYAGGGEVGGLTDYLVRKRAMRKGVFRRSGL